MKFSKTLSIWIGATILFCTAPTAYAQKDLTKEADLIFQAQSYFAAMEAYKKAYPKEAKRTEQSRILYRIGECYRLLQDAPNADQWYLKAEAADYTTADIYVHWGDVLMKQGKYDDAIAKYRTAQGTASGPMKTRADSGVAACEKAVAIQKNPARYVVRNEVQLNTKFYDFSPTFADKKLESIIFTSSRPSTGGNELDPINNESFTDLFTTTRDPKGKWAAPSPLGEPVNGLANEGAAVFDSKYSELYFTRCDYNKKQEFGCEIYKTRSQGQAYATPEVLDFGIDDTLVAGHPAVIDEDLIVYASDIKGGSGGKDLWYIRFDKKLKIWGPPVNLGPDVNTAGDEMFPFIHVNGNLFFASNGHPGLGGMDIFRSEKKGELTWGKPQNLGAPINSSANDFGIIYEEDKDRGFFSSDREGGKGQDDIYSFSMPPLIFKLSGKIADVDTKEPLGNVKVKLLGTDGSVAEIVSDASGVYEFEMRENEERYIVENTAYTIEVNGMEQNASNGNRYLGSKGQETTVGLKESTAFVKDFELLCATCKKEFKMPLVLYPLGKWELLVNETINSKDSLEYLYNLLVENPTIVIELAAHTDTRGTDKANQELSQKRAETCVSYLIDKGIDPERMVPVGYGESKPIFSDAQIAALPNEVEREKAHGKNRRTVFAVLSFDYVPKEPVGGAK